MPRRSEISRIWDTQPARRREKAAPEAPRRPKERPAGVSRRGFLGRAGGLAAACSSGAFGALEALSSTRGSKLQAEALGPLAPEERAERAFQIRVEAADLARQAPIPPQLTNGDEQLYAARFASYSKGLPHDGWGEVDPGAYEQLLSALESGDPAEFEATPLGGSEAGVPRRLVNPQCGLAFDLQGTDSHQLGMTAAPAFASAQTAGEAVELYWMAHLRDVEFDDYERSPLAAQAAEELSRLSDFRGACQQGVVTPRTLFRDSLPGTLQGPYLSQFLLLPAPFGAELVERKMRTLRSGIDYLTEFSEWLQAQRGCQPGAEPEFDPVRRYIRNGRDLAQWVHVDVLFQAYFNAGLILIAPAQQGGIGAPLQATNPYLDSVTQEGFGTFGEPHIMTLLCEVATRALKAVWYQKWFVHRRLRPEAFGGRVHLEASGQGAYPLHAEILNSQALVETFRRWGGGLLPQVYPEGSPLHPSYGAGHATVAGACVTILKAFFEENFPVGAPMIPNPGGRQLLPYKGADAGSLTVGGELNKLASNVATGRNLAGIHWRSDGIESLNLGEAVAVGLLRDQRDLYNEKFEGWTLTGFDGGLITV